MKVRLHPTLMLFALALSFSGCVKQEIELEKLESEEIDPSFAAPLGEATFNLGRIEKEFADDHFIYNATTGLLEYIFPKRLFELELIDMFKFPSQTSNFSISMPSGSQTAFNLAPPGTTVTFYGQNTVNFNSPNGELMDSIVFKDGSLNINISSDFAHDAAINIIIPSLTLNGGAFNRTINLNYAGPLPVTNSVSLDISGYKLDMTDGGTTNNVARLAFAVNLTKGFAPITGTENIDFTVDFVIDTIDRAFGYFGTYTNILSADTMNIDFFESLYGGTIHVEDPRVELTIYNTSGVPVQSYFNAVFAPDNSTTVNLGGPALTTIPLIVGASMIGDTGVTNHLINNSNTSPTLSALVDEGPGRMVYDASSQTNPAGVTQNFISYQSKVWCDARLALPLYGWGNNFNYLDTTKVDLSEALDIDSSDIENIDAVTIRVIADNGLPIETAIQLYFMDSNGVIVDSLFNSASGAVILQSATVNFSVPTSDPLYGTVVPGGTKRKITDVVMDKVRFNNLANSGITHLVYSAKGNTNDANLGRSVKFLPSYNLRMKTSAKVDLKYKYKAK